MVFEDFQGLGIGFQVINYFGGIYKKDNKTLYIKTSNPALFGAMKKNSHLWKLTNQITKDQLNSEFMERQQTSDKGGMLKLRNAITKSYKYIGEPINDNTDVITFNADAWKDVAQNQLNIFDCGA